MLVYPHLLRPRVGIALDGLALGHEVEATAAPMARQRHGKKELPRTMDANVLENSRLFEQRGYAGQISWQIK